MSSRLLQRLATYAFLTLAALLALIPLLSIALMALQTPSVAGAAIDIADAFHIDNIPLAWEQGRFAESFPTSLIVTVATVVIGVPASIAAAYGLVVLRPPGRVIIFAVLIAGIFLPVEAYVVPLFFDLRAVHLTDSLLGVILVECAVNISFGTFWMRSYFVNAPESLIDAARIDGAGPVRTLVSVLLPVARAHVLSLVVLMFVWTWNDLLVPMVLLSSTDARTMPMSLAFFQAQNTTNYPLLAAAAIITIVPVVILYIALQRSFVRGILDGSIK